jgi:ATP-binding cassette subfamily B (MDR/TAP) protein 1
MFLSAFAVGYATSWKLSLVLTAMLPLLGIGGFLVTYLMQSSTKESREAYEKAGGIAEEVLYSIKTVQILVTK